MSSNIRLQKTCNYCGEKFTAKTTVTQFRSDNCAKRAYKKRKREEKIVAVQQEAEKSMYDPQKSILTSSMKNCHHLVKENCGFFDFCYPKAL